VTNAEQKLIVLNDLWKQFKEELKTKYKLEQVHIDRLNAFIDEYQDLQYEIGYKENNKK
jgi:hypothetical protein